MCLTTFAQNEKRNRAKRHLTHPESIISTFTPSVPLRPLETSSLVCHCSRWKSSPAPPCCQRATADAARRCTRVRCECGTASSCSSSMVRHVHWAFELYVLCWFVCKCIAYISDVASHSASWAIHNGVGICSETSDVAGISHWGSLVDFSELRLFDWIIQNPECNIPVDFTPILFLRMITNVDLIIRNIYIIL